MSNLQKLYAAVAVAIALALGGLLLYRRGLHTGRVKEEIHTIDTASATQGKLANTARVIAQRADSAAKRAVARTVIPAKKYREIRHDSTVADTTKLEVADIVIHTDSVAIDSLQIANAKKDLFIIPLARHDSLQTREVKILKAEKTPRFGVKTGIGIGLGLAALTIFLTHR